MFPGACSVSTLNSSRHSFPAFRLRVLSLPFLSFSHSFFLVFAAAYMSPVMLQAPVQPLLRVRQLQRPLSAKGWHHSNTNAHWQPFYPPP